ncbi:RNA-dependent RNA polymerase [Erysiphe necator associated totivirus 5]|nr:RNA-dependent RNA polymerase [Erysiphe necator associated totivirus 5]
MPVSQDTTLHMVSNFRTTDKLEIMIIEKKNKNNKKNINNIQQKELRRDISFRLRGRQVPACVVRRDGGWYAVEYKDCSHVLIATTDSPGVSEEVVFPVMGVAITSVALQGVDKTYIYAKVDQYIVTKSSGVLALLTRHFNELYESVFWDDPLDPRALFRDRTEGSRENRELSVDEAHKLGYPKISAAHHVHFTVKEAAASVSPRVRERIGVALRLPADATATMATGCILWYAGLTDEMYELVKGAGLSRCATVKDFIRVAKSISVEAKSLQNLLPLDLRSVFEIDVLVNRVDGQVDWLSEMQHRTEPNTANLSYEQVFSGALAIFQQAAMIGRAPTSMNWNKYWSSRWQWSAAGSVHSQYSLDEQYIVKTDRNLKNKFIMISNMPNYAADHFLSRKPEIHAWASTKYEWGKLRAIYGTDTTSYILSNFVFYNCENVLPNRFPVGKDANDANVTGRVAGVLKNRLPYCLDFEDFNSQHSIPSMQAVVDAYGVAFSNTLSEEQMQALRWTSESIAHQTINDNTGLKRQYKASGTLLSGWRLTTFVNSVLNAVYTDSVLAGIKTAGSSLHNGDDVLIGATNLEVTRRSLSVGEELGIRIQPSKCAFAGIAEFLRVDHKRGSKGQYLSRAIATLVHSRIESKASTDARDLVGSMENRFADCLNRGLDLRTIATLRHLYYKHQATVCGMETHELYTIKTTHRVAGGISEAPDARVDMFVLAGEATKGDIIVPKLAGVGAYAWEVAKTLDMEDRAEEMVSRVYKATYEAVMPKNRRMRVLPNNRIQWCTNVKQIYRAFKGTVTTASYGKAALVGFALDVLQTRSLETTLVMALARSSNPQRLLKYLI